jgi:uncharacterized protein
MVTQTLLQPQEIEVFYVIPALKKYLSVAMKEKGMKQNKIAELLSIKDATVSQYLSKKRGNKVEFDETMLKEINESVPLIKDKLSLLKEIQKLLRRVKETREICRIHKQLSEIPEECSPELINCFGGENDTKNTGICY